MSKDYISQTGYKFKYGKLGLGPDRLDYDHQSATEIANLEIENEALRAEIKEWENKSNVKT